MLMLLLVLSGLALVANAVVLALEHERKLSFVTVGLVVVVAMDLAVIAALASPFEGSISVSRAPLQTVVDDVREHRIG